MAGKYSSGINNLDIINNEEPQEQCTGEEQCSSEQGEGHKEMHTNNPLVVSERMTDSKWFFYCNSCQINFLYLRSKIVHLLRVHKLQGPKFSCSLCQQKHSNIDELQCHMLIHIGKESNIFDINDVNLALFESDGPDLPAFAVTNDTSSQHSLKDGEIKSEHE